MKGPSGRYNRECELLNGTRATKLTKERTDRPHCEALLDVSHEDKPLSRVINTEDESLCAWADATATPSIISQAPRRRKQKDEVSRGYLQQEEVNRLYQPGHKSRYDKFDLPFDTFRRCVEASSWDYTPNNAQYRRAKTQNRQSPDSTTVRRTSKYITAAQKQLQREIQHELRRQYEREKEREQINEFERDSRIQDKILSERSVGSDKMVKSPTNNNASVKNVNIQGDSLNGASVKLQTNDSPSKSEQKESEYIVYDKERASPGSHVYSKTKVEPNLAQKAGRGEELVDVKKVEKLIKQLPPLEVPLATRGHRPGAYLSSRLSIMEEEMRRDLLMRNNSQDDTILSYRSRSEPSAKGVSDKNSFMHPVLQSLFTVKSLNKAKKLGYNKSGRSMSQAKLLQKNRTQESPPSATNSAPNSGMLRLRHGPENLEYKLSLGVNSLKKPQQTSVDKLTENILKETQWGVPYSPPSREGNVELRQDEASGDALQAVQNFTVVSGKGIPVVPAFQRIL